MQGDGQLNRAQPGGQVPAGRGYRFEQKFTHLGCQLYQLRVVESAQVGRGVDGFKDLVSVWHVVTAGEF